jgi:hypothetical protein
MSEKQTKPSSGGKTLKLCLLIVLVLLVPVVMDQVDVDRESVRLVGRVSAGITGLLFLYGIFTKMLKVLAFAVLALIAVVFLVSEGHIEAPRVQSWFDGRSKGR